MLGAVHDTKPTFSQRLHVTKTLVLNSDHVFRQIVLQRQISITFIRKQKTRDVQKLVTEYQSEL